MVLVVTKLEPNIVRGVKGTLFFCPSDGGAAASGAVKHAYVLLLSRSHKHFAAAATTHNSEAADAINKQIYYF